MTTYRKKLPQLGEDIFLTDSGMETDLLFNKGFELPHFASFTLLKDETGRAAMREYCLEHARLAKRYGFGFIFETATWRASPDWGPKLGYDRAALEAANRDAIALIEEVRDEGALERPFVISANVGPRGDGYQAGALMTVQEAEDYHSFQAEIFAGTAADITTALTMNNTPEAIGFVNAAAAAGMPCAVSFTVETDGRLPSGQPLGEAIMETDFEARKAPAYYMINCAHPTHFTNVLRDSDHWLSRLKGVRANASKCSHAELDEAEALDDGNPGELALENEALRRLVPSLTIFGGCCGTDLRHVSAIAQEISRAKKVAA